MGLLPKIFCVNLWQREQSGENGMSEALLTNRDYTVMVAKTAPSTQALPPGYAQRWQAAHDAILALAQACETYDPDGIAVYISCKSISGFERYRQVKSRELRDVFDRHYPPSDCSLRDGLEKALTDYFARKAAGQTKPNGEIIIVLIDGEPQDRMAIAHTIVEATQRLEHSEELRIGFVQIGDDLLARGFLQALDENLRSAAGAKFDIVRTHTIAEIAPNSLTEFLLDIIHG